MEITTAKAGRSEMEKKEETPKDGAGGNVVIDRIVRCGYSCNCRHWGNIPSNYVSGEKVKSCKSPKMITGYMISPNDLCEDGIMVENDEGWSCFTGAKFGCINFVSQ